MTENANITDNNNGANGNTNGNTGGGDPAPGVSGQQVTLHVSGLGHEGEDISTVEADNRIPKDQRRTVQAILEDAGTRGSGLVNGYLDTLDELRSKRELDQGTYKDDLTPEQQRSVLLKSKVAEAADKRAAVKEAYTENLRPTHEALAKRREALREDLYAIKDPALLTRAVLCTEDELRNLTAVAVQIGGSGSDLLKSCLVAAERRGMGDVLNTIFEEHPEFGELYQEWHALPPKEALKRQLEGVDRVIPEPTAERLTPPARVGAY
jgi:hypothetical protein